LRDARESNAKGHAVTIWPVMGLNKAPIAFRNEFDHVEPDTLVAISHRGIAKRAKEIKKGVGIVWQERAAVRKLKYCTLISPGKGDSFGVPFAW